MVDRHVEHVGVAHPVAKVAGREGLRVSRRQATLTASTSPIAPAATRLWTVRAGPSEAVVLADHQRPPARRGGRDQIPGLRQGRRQRFLQQDVFAGPQGGRGDRVVRLRRGDDERRIPTVAAKCLVETGQAIARRQTQVVAAQVRAASSGSTTATSSAPALPRTTPPTAAQTRRPRPGLPASPRPFPATPRAALFLDRARGEATDDEALQAGEDGDDRDRDRRRDRHQHVPLGCRTGR